MYEQYWQLNCAPFENNSDPGFFFGARSHHATLLKLRYLVENGKGGGLVIGGVGIGKTYLIEVLRDQLPETYGPIAHLGFPQLSPGELLSYLAVELGADESAVTGSDAGLDRTIRCIEQQLVRSAEQGRHPILVIDEAHLIDDPRVFQTLQLLLNFRRPGQVDFSLVLAGEHALLSRVQRIAQLDDRLAVKCVLQPLTADETARYVAHRLEVAGTRQPIFDDSAIHALYELSGGVPRRINRLCDLALLVGYADRMTVVSEAHIDAVSEELVAVVPD